MQNHEKEKMKHCTKCEKAHDEKHPHFQIKSRLTDKGFPTHSNRYRQAHNQANKEEKKEFGEKAFKQLEKIVRKVEKHELVGKNLKSGKIEVEKKVPKSLRPEVAFHEKVENKALTRKKK